MRKTHHKICYCLIARMQWGSLCTCGHSAFDHDEFGCSKMEATNEIACIGCLIDGQDHSCGFVVFGYRRGEEHESAPVADGSD